MKKIFYFLTSIILIFCINACSGYKPIFSSSNLSFEIVNHSLEGNKRFGGKIYSNLKNLSRASKNNPIAKSIDIFIKVTKDKEATAKNSAGKILEYKITINTNAIIGDYLTDDIILDKNFVYSSSYKVQDQHSETIKLENTIIENLLDKTYQSLLIEMTKNI